MALGNKGFAARIAGAGAGTAPAEAATRLPPRTGVLGARESRLAELAAGGIVTRVHELVDPARCRIWDGHNRDYAALNEQSCADLIDSFKAQGRQEVPAIVRRLPAEAEHAYEVVCGARRHWTASWLRAHDYPDFKFLIEPRELTDEEAFRLADLENRSRKDLSDYERASDYARAVDRYYEGNQQRMAERLEVSKSWLSRYLDLARLPAEILAAFGSPQALGISHAATLAPLLRRPGTLPRLLEAAATLAAEQALRAQKGEGWLSPATVLRRLTQAATAAPAARPRPKEHVVRSAEGALLARGQRGARGGAVAISFPAPGQHDRAALLEAVGEILDHLTTKSGG
jgi:ParB family chromosome partitioning protein